MPLMVVIGILDRSLIDDRLVKWYEEHKGIYSAMEGMYQWYEEDPKRKADYPC